MHLFLLGLCLDSLMQATAWFGLSTIDIIAVLMKGGELEGICSGHSKIQIKQAMEVYWLIRDQMKDTEEDYEQQRSEKLT